MDLCFSRRKSLAKGIWSSGSNSYNVRVWKKLLWLWAAVHIEWCFSKWGLQHNSNTLELDRHGNSWLPAAHLLPGLWNQKLWRSPAISGLTSPLDNSDVPLSLRWFWVHKCVTALLIWAFKRGGVSILSSRMPLSRNILFGEFHCTSIFKIYLVIHPVYFPKWFSQMAK